MRRVSRRFVLGGALGALAFDAWAEAPERSLRPLARPAPVAARPRGSAGPLPAELIRSANLGGRVGYVVADARTGQVLDAIGGDLAMPPASTMKIITSLYALEHLGADHRFATRLVATGPLRGSRINGDLVLAGGGDPVLSTDALGDMATALRRAGVGGASGRFLVWGGALPFLPAIDRSQPEWLGYNPAVSGLNLNFNRVNFVWKRSGHDYALAMDARDRRFAPPVYSARIRAVERERPVYDRAERGGVEEWTVARRALGSGGSRWLPVRRPDLYAGDVFQTLARAEGVPLPAPQAIAALPGGTVLVDHRSEPLRPVLRDMMRYSTNMTAEAVGMAASTRLGAASHLGSARAMSDWIGRAAGLSGARLVDHSGLGAASRLSAADMVSVLVRLGPQAGLRGLMKPVVLKDAGGGRAAGALPKVDAKTGTLNFVSALAGYASLPGGRELAFAIFTADVARRDAVAPGERERPAGSDTWVRRSRALQQQLVAHWAAVHAG